MNYICGGNKGAVKPRVVSASGWSRLAAFLCVGAGLIGSTPATAAELSQGCIDINAQYSSGLVLSISSGDPYWDPSGNLLVSSQHLYASPISPGETITWSLTGSGGSTNDSYARVTVYGGYLHWFEEYDTKGTGVISAQGSHTVLETDPSDFGISLGAFRLPQAESHTSLTITLTCTASEPTAPVAEHIDNLVHTFVRARQTLMSSGIKVPGLVERRQAAAPKDSVTVGFTPSASAYAASFSTSLTQVESAWNSIEGGADGPSSPFNVWLDGAVILHNAGGTDGRWGSFSMIGFGADYLVTDKVLLGLSAHFDQLTSPTGDDDELSGQGWLAGPYASVELGSGVFWETKLLYGHSSNDIDTASWDGSFDTTRWLADTSIGHEWKLDEATILTPRLRAFYMSETVDDYVVANDVGDEIEAEGFREEQFRLSTGAEVARSFTLENGMTATPRLGATGGIADFDLQAGFAEVSAGFSLQGIDAWALEFGLSAGIEGSGQRSVGVKTAVGGQF